MLRSTHKPHRRVGWKWLGTVFGLTGLLVTVPVLTNSAAAQALCGDHKTVVRYLGKKYQESLSNIGLAANGGVLEVFSSAKGSWTIVITKPDGQACMIMAGESWEAIEAPVLDDQVSSLSPSDSGSDNGNAG